VGDDGVILFGGIVKPPFEQTAREWGTDSIGVTTPATKWYLAEGSTGPGFETWVLVQNPNPTDVFVFVTFMTPTGTARELTDRITANSRTTYNVADYVPNTYEVSTKVESSGPAGANGPDCYPA
jgi:hypothetical protein